MPESRKVDIRKRACAFDDVFKINELVVSHQQLDGSMSPDEKRLVFERGDSAAVLLFNKDTKRVVLVNQFKAPTLGKGQEGGWITETVAGIVEQYETPVQTAIRETMEETGYKIGDPKHIATFFSSPGGSSERIFLYYAEVGEADKIGKGGGIDGEDIAVRQISLDQLFEQLRGKDIEDPKLMIAALWLQEELKSQARKPLEHSGVMSALAKHPDLFVGYKTGPIGDIRNVKIWVNTENEDMIMDRFIGRSISANIRYLGADKDSSDNLTEDTVNEELTNAIGRGSPVRIGTVIETRPGKLADTHNVDAIFHVATVRGAGAGLGVKADLADLARCTRNVLVKAHQRNQRLQWLPRFLRPQPSESILIPMIGAGDGGLQNDQVAPILISTAIRYLHENPTTTLKRIYFLAFTAGQKSAYDRELEVLHAEGVITQPQREP